MFSISTKVENTIIMQAEKWHLNLDTDTSELENRELLEAVKQWEEREFSGAKIDTSLKEKKKLAPLNEGGPTQLLQIQIQKLEQENQALKLRIKTVEICRMIGRFDFQH